jgi:hypothetical protein
MFLSLQTLIGISLIGNALCLWLIAGLQDKIKELQSKKIIK